MPLWFRSSTFQNAPGSEQRTAALLGPLGDGFAIRWGFSYRNYEGVWREGDFLVQGPDGHVLVMEAKAGEPTLDSLTGIWSTADGENPFKQLDCQWKGALDWMSRRGEEMGIGLPFIGSALALPDVCYSSDQHVVAGQPRDRVLDQNDLRDFGAWWKRHMASRPSRPGTDGARKLFRSAFLCDSVTSKTLEFADELMERHTRERFEVLDALADHEQLIFRGGPGTGKTRIAVEVAKRWAALGRRVLLLCYNLALERWLKAVCQRIQGTIEVYSYATLCHWILGRDVPNFNSEAERTEYFDVSLPRAVGERLARTDFTPLFDALVVDEAQDHNTAPNLQCELPGPGWWALYLRLLVKGAEAPIAIFYDASQRLVLRSGHFKSEDLGNTLWQPVSVRLRHPLRYSRQLVRYFKQLSCTHTAGMLEGISSKLSLLPAGPDPELYTEVRAENEGAVVSGLVSRWIRNEMACLEDILVLYPSSRRVPPWVVQGRCHGVSYQVVGENQRADAVMAVSIHQAKGLERKAVIVVGLSDWRDASQDAYQAVTYLQGVTRAQRLLAVVTRPKVQE